MTNSDALTEAMGSLTKHLDDQGLGLMPYAMKGNPKTGRIVVVQIHPKLQIPTPWAGFPVEIRPDGPGALVG